MLNYDFNRVNLNSSFHLQGDSKRFSVPYKKLTKRRTGTFHTANLLRGGEEEALLPVLSIVLHRFSIFPSRLISVRWVPVEWMESICKTWRIFILSTRNVAEICMDWLSHAGRSEHSDAIFSKIFVSFFFPNLSWLREIKSNPRQKRKKGTLLRRDTTLNRFRITFA